MDDIRLDKYLWAVRVFKTRSDAADAIRNNKVTVNGSAAKPSRAVKVGDVIAVRKMQVTYSYRVLDLVSSRQPAKNVPLYCLNITPQEELDKLSIPRETIFVFRDRGTGRPTKKERRELDGADGRNLLRRDEKRNSMSGKLPIRTLDLRVVVRSRRPGRSAAGAPHPGRAGARHPCARQGLSGAVLFHLGCGRFRRHVSASGRRG